MGIDLWNHSKFLHQKVRNMTRRGWLLKTYNDGKLLKARIKTGEKLENDKIDILHPIGYVAHVKPTEKTEVFTMDVGGDTSRRVITCILGDREDHPKPDENEAFVYAPGEKQGKQFFRIKRKRDQQGGGGQQFAEGKDSSGNKDSGRIAGMHWDQLEEKIAGKTTNTFASKSDKGVGFSTDQGSFEIKAGQNTQFEAQKHVRKGDHHVQGNTYTSGTEHAADHVAGGGTSITGGGIAAFADATGEVKPDGSSPWSAQGQPGTVSLLATASSLGSFMQHTNNRLAALEGQEPPVIPEIPPDYTQSIGTPAQLRASTPDKLINTTGLQGALTFVNLGNVSGAVTPDFTQFINARFNLAGNITLAFPTVSVAPLIGRSGLLLFYNTVSASITIVTPGVQGYTYHKFEALDLVTTAARYNLLSYSIWDATRINLALLAGGIY